MLTSEFEAMIRNYDASPVDGDENTGMRAVVRALLGAMDEARAEVADFKANNRYQRGYHDGQLEGLGRRGDTFRLVEEECKRNDERWGADRTQDWGKWQMILTEEVGEVARAMLEHHASPHLPIAHPVLLRRIEEEAVQVAAVAIEIVRDAQRRHAELEGGQP